MRTFLVTLAALMPAAIHASTGRDPLDYTLREYVFYLGAALFGGIVNWLNKLMRKEASAFDLLRLIGELATSAFVGLVVFFACEAFSTPKLLTICIVAVSGHMGTRALLRIEVMAAKAAARRFGLPEPTPDDMKEPTQ